MSACVAELMPPLEAGSASDVFLETRIKQRTGLVHPFLSAVVHANACLRHDLTPLFSESPERMTRGIKFLQRLLGAKPCYVSGRCFEHLQH
jgi:hypothetical protein